MSMQHPNLFKTPHRQPVRDFMQANISDSDRIAGLLDYGYSVLQVADMMKLHPTTVRKTMQKHGYTEFIDEKIV